jgi:hypothetical protein
LITRQGFCKLSLPELLKPKLLIRQSQLQLVIESLSGNDLLIMELVEF